MSDVVTFTSGVHVGTRGAGAINQGWFGETPTTQFATFSLSLSDVQALTSVEGRAGDKEPVLLRFQGGGLPAAYEKLKAVDARDLLNGTGRTTLSGAMDAVARSGFLLEMALELEGDTAPRTEWGVLSQVRNSVAGGMRGWSVSAVFVPCAVFSWTGTENVFVDPITYATLDAGS
jgi:hypothetical protein